MTKKTPNHIDSDALRLAAPAPLTNGEDVSPSLNNEQRDLDDLCERWVAWKATRRLFAPAPSTGSVLGQLSGTRTRPLQPGGPDALCSAELAAMHMAYLCQPDTLDKRVFDLYYVHRITPIKSAAAALEISRSHFYFLLASFRVRLRTASLALMEQEKEVLRALQSARAEHTARAKE